MTLALVSDPNTGEIWTPAFDEFWTLYPRRVARKDATRAWLRLTEGQKISAILALVEWRRVWASKDVQFLPHAATWLNGERWEDELPPEYRDTSASHRPAVIEQEERGEMPAHVRELLAKLRRGK